MRVLADLISLVCTVYAVGLVIYVVLSWAQSPHVEKARSFLGQFYLPFLKPLRQRFRPIRMGATGALDLCPWILLAAIVMVRWMLVLIVVG